MDNTTFITEIRRFCNELADDATKYRLDSHPIFAGVGARSEYCRARLQAMLDIFAPVELPVVRVPFYIEKCCSQCGAPLDNQEARYYSTCEDCFYSFMD